MFRNSVYIAISILLPVILILFLERNSISDNFISKKIIFPTPTIHIIDMTMVKVDENKLFEAVENYRESIGLPRQEIDERLCKIASERSQLNKTDDHDGFISNIKRYFEIAPFYQMNENIVGNTGYTEDPAAYALNLWLGSPGHKQTIEDTFTHSCLKCGKDVCTQIFAR